MRTRILTPILAAALAVAASASAFAAEYDLIIRNGKILDGSGKPAVEGDVAVKGDTIVAIGKLGKEATAAEVIDAQGNYIVPGFIDVHTHVEGDLNRNPEAENFVRMGVTTLVTGNCGGSYLNIGDSFTSLSLKGIGVNLSTLVGHNTVRREVMGNTRRDPSTTEIEEMKRLVARGMEDGALGISTGLIYTPGLYSKTPEIMELAKVASKYGGLYVSHMRNEGSTVTEAIQEALDIGTAAGCPVQISHFKISAPRRHGDSTMTIAMVEEARKKGQDVSVDQYVYTASSTSLRIQLPDWANEGTTTDIAIRINDPAQRQKIIDEMIRDKHTIGQRPDMSYAQVANFKADTSLNGKNILEITKLLKGTDTWQAQMETILDMISSGSAGMVYHSMAEEDVQRIAAYEHTMFASDSGVRTFNEGVPHPRGYGNNARVLARYVRQLNVLSVEEAVRKMTSLPAGKFGFKDRGLIKEGFKADLSVLDYDKVNDPSTFENPHQYSVGFPYVAVNGTLVIKDDKMTSAFPGQILRGPGYEAAATTGSGEQMPSGN